VQMKGNHEIVALKIDPEAVKDGDVEMLQDMIMAAVNEANRKVDEAMKGKLGGMLPPGLGNLFGSFLTHHMLEHADPVTKLIDELKRLPSIGHKSAQRLAFHIMRAPEADLERLIGALREVKQKIVLCSVCNNLTEVNPCRFCASPSRDHSMICVVEEPHSLVAVEKTRSFKGV